MVEVAVQKKRKANLTRINLILEKCIEIEYMSGSWCIKDQREKQISTE